MAAVVYVGAAVGRDKPRRLINNANGRTMLQGSAAFTCSGLRVLVELRIFKVATATNSDVTTTKLISTSPLDKTATINYI
jgi:hypothetical protein